MTQLAMDLPEDVFSALRLAPRASLPLKSGKGDHAPMS